MRFTALLFTCAAVVPGASAAPVPKSLKKRSEAEVFVGTWDLVEKPRGVGTQYTWRFDPDLTMWSKGERENGAGTKWLIRIEPDKTPKEIDFANGGNKYQGLYEIDGDEIRIVYSGERPTDFDQKERNNYTVLRRAK